MPKNWDLPPPVVAVTSVAAVETVDIVHADCDSDNIRPSYEEVEYSYVASCVAAAGVVHVDNCRSYRTSAHQGGYWGWDAAPVPEDEWES